MLNEGMKMNKNKIYFIIFLAVIGLFSINTSLCSEERTPKEKEEKPLINLTELIKEEYEQPSSMEQEKKTRLAPKPKQLSFTAEEEAMLKGFEEIFHEEEEEVEKYLKEAEVISREVNVAEKQKASLLQELLPYFSLLKPVKRMAAGFFYALEQANIKTAFKGFAYDENTKNGGIRSAYFFEPHEINKEEKPIVLFLVHGTGFELWGLGIGGHHTKEYFDIENPIFQKILEFAYKYAESKKTIIAIFSFRWNGANNVKGRRDAGYRIGELLAAHFKSYSIITYSHSHGGNVVNVASHITTWEHTDGTPAIDKIINMGTPDRTRSTDTESAQEYTPTNFKTLINFWSPGDWIQPLGAIETASDAIRMLIDAIGLFKEERKLESPSTRIYNVRVQVVGKNPLGHSEYVGPISVNLFQILQEIDKYRLHVYLNLYISPKDNKIFLAIEHPVHETEYWNVLKYIVFDEEVVFGETILKIPPELQQTVRDVLKEERERSIKAKKAFHDEYGKYMTKSKSKSNYTIVKADKRKGSRIAG